MKKLSIFTIAVSVLFASCVKNESTVLNVNPKLAPSNTAAGLFTDGELSFVNTYNTTSIAIAPFRVLSQEWTENVYVYEANYNFAAYNAPGGFWQNEYVNTIHNLELARQSWANGWGGTAAGLESSQDITTLLEIYSYYMLMATYGNIPYSQAEDPTIPFPAFDDAKTVYADLLTRLDTCIAGLANNDGSAMGNADQIYFGNPVQWLKFAASLKVKMAMLNQFNDPTTAKTKVTEALATGVFTSNADNALFTYDAGSVTNSNPIWNALEYSGRHDFGPSDFLVNTMVGLNDPRLPDYYTLYKDSAYVGAPAGDPSDSYGGYSDFCCVANNTNLYNPSLKGDILDYAEVNFYLAEAAADPGVALASTHTAAQYYDSAVAASITFWGGAYGDALTYLAQPSVNYATQVGTTSWQQTIGYQHWIANFNRNWDSWTDIRRLGQPNIDVVSPPGSPNGNFPLRLYYPPNETTSNAKNTAAAVAALPGGADVVSAKLFWEP